MPRARAGRIHRYRAHFKPSALRRRIAVGTATCLKEVSNETATCDVWQSNSNERRSSGSGGFAIQFQRASVVRSIRPVGSWSPVWDKANSAQNEYDHWEFLSLTEGLAFLLQLSSSFPCFRIIYFILSNVIIISHWRNENHFCTEGQFYLL